MVKVPSASQKSELRSLKSFDVVPGTTYLGHSEVIGVAFFLDWDAPPTILIRFDGKKPIKMPWLEFVELVRCFKFFRQKVSQILQDRSATLPRLSLPDDFSLFFLESKRIKLRWKDNVKVLSIIQFGLVTDVIGGTYVKARPLAERILEKERLLARPGFRQTVGKYGGFVLFVFLSALNFLVFISMFFQSALFFPWAVLSVFMALWLLLLRPDWMFRVLPVLRDYINEQFLADLSNLRLPRKSIEFFFIIFIGIIYLLGFAGEAATYILKFYRSVY